MRMLPVTDPQMFVQITAWAIEQKVDPPVPGWQTWQFVDDNGAFYGFYQQGARLCSHFHVDNGGNRVKTLRCYNKIVNMLEATGARPLMLVPEDGSMRPLMDKYQERVDAIPFVTGPSREA